MSALLANLATIYKYTSYRAVRYLGLTAKSMLLYVFEANKHEFVSRAVFCVLCTITRILATLDIGCQAAAGRTSARCFQIRLHNELFKLLPKGPRIDNSFRV